MLGFFANEAPAHAACGMRGQMTRDFQKIIRSQRATMMGATLAGLTSAMITPADATDLCVTCLGPDATYTCAVENASLANDDPRLRLYCITELAKAGRHSSCAINRASASPCAGERKVLAAPAGFDFDAPSPLTAPAPQQSGVTPKSAADQPPISGAATTTTPSPPEQTTEVPKTEAPPKTVQEMVEKGAASTQKTIEDTGEGAANAAKTTGTAIQNAGKAVGDAAKKTWTCLTSFFGDC